MVDMSRKASEVKWTERMNSDILECKKKAREMVSSNNPPYYTNGRKKGYIEVMKDLSEEKGYVIVSINIYLFFFYLFLLR